MTDRNLKVSDRNAKKQNERGAIVKNVSDRKLCYCNDCNCAAFQCSIPNRPSMGIV